MNAFVNDAVETLRQHGLAAEIEPGRGSHTKIRFINANGSKCLLVVPRPSRSWHAIRSYRAELRRLMKRRPR
jgi:hypothetical protein